MRTGKKAGKTWGLAEIDDAAIAALTEPLAVWLPNALIDGAANEVPPIELIRQTRSLPALRLLIELYAVQFLQYRWRAARIDQGCIQARQGRGARPVRGVGLPLIEHGR